MDCIAFGKVSTAKDCIWTASWQNQQNGMCAQRKLRSAWASAESHQSSLSSLSAWRKLGSLATHWANGKDSDQAGRMPRLIWVFARCTCNFVGFVTRRLIYSVQAGIMSRQALYRVTTTEFLWSVPLYRTYVVTFLFFKRLGFKGPKVVVLVVFNFCMVLWCHRALSRIVWFEPRHDKTSKMTCAPSEDSDQPAHPPSLIRIFAVRFLYTDSEDADQTGRISLIWVFAGRTSHFVGFVMLRLILY